MQRNHFACRSPGAIKKTADQAQESQPQELPPSADVAACAQKKAGTLTVQVLFQ
jgi:hypothetical protein